MVLKKIKTEIQRLAGAKSETPVFPDKESRMPSIYNDSSFQSCIIPDSEDTASDLNQALILTQHDFERSSSGRIPHTILRTARAPPPQNKFRHGKQIINQSCNRHIRKEEADDLISIGET